MLEEAFLRLSWPLMLVTLIIAAATYTELWRNHWLVPKCWKKVLLSSVILTAVVVFSVRQEYRTLSDETNLLSVSQSMVFNKSVENRMSGVTYFDIFHPTSHWSDKRPILFPFIMSLVHYVAGFQPMAGAYANCATLFSLLFIVGVIGFNLFGFSGSIGLQLLLLSHPLISEYATCAGFDLFASVFVVFALVSAYIYSATPSKESLRALLITLVLLCHCRYESFLFAGIIFIGLILMLKLSLSALWKEKGFIGICLILLLPLIAQRIISVGTYEQPEGEALFHYSHLVKNGLAFLKNFWRINFFDPYNQILNILWVVGLIPACAYLIKKKDCIGIITVASFLASFAVVMFHTAGDMTGATQARYFIIFCFFTLYVWLILSVKFKLDGNFQLLFGAISFLVFHPVAIEDKLHAALILNRELRFEMAQIAPYNKQNILVISERPGMFAAQRISAIDYATALRKGQYKELQEHMRDGTFDKIFVFQHYVFKEGIQKGNELPGWPLKEIADRMVNSDHKVVVSELLLEEPSAK